MNPAELGAPVRLLADRIFRLPAVGPPELLDAISFEDTESALARLLGGYLPAPGARNAVADRRGGAVPAEPPRSGAPRPVRFGSPHSIRTGRGTSGAQPGESRPALPGEPDAGGHADSATPDVAAAPTSAGAEPPQWTDKDTPTGGPVTRLERGAAALSAVLHSTARPNIAAARREMSTEDAPVRPELPHRPAPMPDVAEPSAVLPEPDRKTGDTTVLAEPTGSPADPWPALETEPMEALVHAVLLRVRDELELEFLRAYGFGGW